MAYQSYMATTWPSLHAGHVANVTKAGSPLGQAHASSPSDNGRCPCEPSAKTSQGKLHKHISLSFKVRCQSRDHKTEHIVMGAAADDLV